ncbi:glycosyltransferase [Halomonas alkaliantarctica]|nr:glycosyltransferase [Halomonas alkaliantarctica]
MKTQPTKNAVTPGVEQANSGQVDEAWYFSAYPEAELTGLTAQEHYERIGKSLGRQPRGDRKMLALASEQRDTVVKKMREQWARLKGIGASSKKINGSASKADAALLLGYQQAGEEHRSSPFYTHLLEVLKQPQQEGMLYRLNDTLARVDQARCGQLPPAQGPLISIVMPVWNRAELVKDAIHSVLAQTYTHFELLICDDASRDNSWKVISAFDDARIKTYKQSKQAGAAAARNRCLEAASGDYIAYLDSDNIWHPRYLELLIEHIAQWPNHGVYYADYIDVQYDEGKNAKIRNICQQEFFLEDQIDAPYIDLNSIIHSADLYRLLGGFDESLKRRQDYDLLVRYCWGRAAKRLPVALNLYRRIPAIGQITETKRNDSRSLNSIEQKIDAYYTDGVPVKWPEWVKKVTVISWDMSRNHFAKAYAVAEALSQQVNVELISFRFFEVPVFKPLENVTPRFEVKYFEGGHFPDFFTTMAQAINAVEGDVIYCVKPRLTSLGVALMANYHKGTPVFLEANDLETVVASPSTKVQHAEHPLEAVFDQMEQAKTPYELIWSQVLEPCVKCLPTLFTHNINLDLHYGARAHYMRNIKDASIFNPSRYDRDHIRQALGFEKQDKVIFFGGLVRKHKGIFELVELLDKLKDPTYKLLVVGSRETPDLQKLVEKHKNVTVLPPQPPEKMAELNYAADFVILWLDPTVRASHYQSPYKMSDALAMGPAIIASPVSDQAAFARHEVMWQVPFGNFDSLVCTIQHIQANPEERAYRQRRARRLFLREFSYQAVPAAFARGASQVTERNRVYPIAERFAHFFSEFERRCAQSKEAGEA